MISKSRGQRLTDESLLGDDEEVVLDHLRHVDRVGHAGILVRKVPHREFKVLIRILRCDEQQLLMFEWLQEVVYQFSSWHFQLTFINDDELVLIEFG